MKNHKCSCGHVPCRCPKTRTGPRSTEPGCGCTPRPCQGKCKALKTSQILKFYGVALFVEIEPGRDVLSYLSDSPEPISTPGVQYPLGSARTFTKLTVNLLGPLVVIAPPPTPQTVVVTLLKNGLATGLTVTFTAPVGSPPNVLSASLPVAFSPNDTLDMQVSASFLTSGIFLSATLE